MYVKNGINIVGIRLLIDCLLIAQDAVHAIHMIDMLVLWKVVPKDVPHSAPDLVFKVDQKATPL